MTRSTHIVKYKYLENRIFVNYLYITKDLMQGKLFQKCTHLLHKKSMKYSGHRKLLCELSKLSKLDALILLGYLTSIDASIFVYKFRPERTGFNMYAEYTQLQLSLHYNLVTSKDIRSFF